MPEGAAKQSAISRSLSETSNIVRMFARFLPLESPARELSAGFAFRTCDHHHLPVGVADPHLPMRGFPVDVRLLDDLGMQ